LPLPSRLSFRGALKARAMMCNCTSENLEIPRCAITHLRSGANAPSRNDGINAAARRFTFQTAKTIGRSRILGLVVRDARRCRAPHHEGLADLILRSRARRGVSKDVAPTLSHRSHEPPFSRRDCVRVVQESFASKTRAQGMPGARRTRSLVCEFWKSTQA